jgi:hypothetical protein
MRKYNRTSVRLIFHHWKRIGSYEVNFGVDVVRGRKSAIGH